LQQELLDDLGAHDGDGPHQIAENDGLEAAKPPKDGKGHQEIDWYGLASQHS
jgi:hypothetical protein